jgi:hypothetical protein
MKAKTSCGRISVLGMLGALILISGCLPMRPAVPRAAPRFDANKYRADRLKMLAPTIETNVNLFDVQFVADFTSDATIKRAADDRVLRLIGESHSLRDMLFLSVHTPQSAHGDDARIRAELLLTQFRNEGAPRIPDLLAAVYSPSNYRPRPIRPGASTTTSDLRISASQTMSNVLQSPLEASIIATAKQVITNAYDQITEDDYSHDFSIEDTSLSALVAKIKTNYHHSDVESVDILYSVVGGQGQLTVTPESTYGRTPAASARARAGIRRDSFKATGLSYERWRYTSSGIVREFVRRESNSSGRAVSTEVITWNGIHYRKSAIEGF